MSKYRYVNDPAEKSNVSLTPADEKTTSAPPGKVTVALVVTAAASVFGASFTHGWNTGVLNNPYHLIHEFLNRTYSARIGDDPSESLLSLLIATTVSIYLIGGCIGAMFAGLLADLCGRKKALMITYTTGYVAAILFGFCKLANSFEMLIIGRFVVGLGCGAGTVLTPMFLTEIAPVNYRGAMGVMHQFGLTCGIMCSQIMGFREVLGSEERWPILIALTALPCLVSMLVLPWFPDSPRYLLLKLGNDKEAEKALQRFRGKQDVRADMRELYEERSQSRAQESWTILRIFRTRTLWMPLLLVCAINVAQQLSGINVVFYYSTNVFLASGIPKDKTQYAVMGTGAMNVLLTGISVPLMEKAGRKPLLLGGMIIMAVSVIILTVGLNLQDQASWLSYVSMACIFVFVIGFSIGLGSIPQFAGAELFRQGPRPSAMSLASLLNWIANFAVGIIFLPMRLALEAYSFIPFVVILILFGAFVWWKFPETKNKSIEEIYRLFNKGKDVISDPDQIQMFAPNTSPEAEAFIRQNEETRNDSARFP